MFDRSWYGWAGVERVMGFTEPREYMEALRTTAYPERRLVRSGTTLVKLRFPVSQNERLTGFTIRRIKALDVATDPGPLVVGAAAELFEYGERPGRFPPLAARAHG